jgi:predicted neuraminidase|tara:strand:+ start:494 stop:1645 length:1152 start_codon:yes stop_codon:yes gene_type:complete
MTRYLKYATTVAVTAAVLALPSSAVTQEATEILEKVAPADTPTKTVEINVAGSLELQAGMYGGEMIAEKMPVAGVHASTIAEIEGGIVTAWFGGADEGAYDVVIWMSRNEGSGWSAPKPAADGVDAARRIQYPCWNPVLFKQSNGTLLLFYKVGPTPTKWWGMLRKSKDDGLTWEKPIRLPEGYVGPVKNKPIELANGTLLCGSSLEDAGWRVQMERYVQNRYWSKTKPLNSPLDYAAIQPTLLAYPDGSIQALCRTKSGRLTECWSSDSGKKWTRMMRTQLPNPNAGVDGTVLADGRALLVYNHTRRGRSPLNVSVSTNGKTWEAALVLENQPGEYSYPAVIQTSDGNVHVTYTHNRTNIKHVVIDPAKLSTQPIVEGQWPQ